MEKVKQIYGIALKPVHHRPGFRGSRISKTG